MPYVERDGSGTIIGVRKLASPQASEFLPDTDPEVLGFFGQSGDVHAALAESDQAFARVTEDLIELLVRKGFIMFTELPAEVQRKLHARAGLRSRLGGATAGFLSEDETL
jgi:hypothetical protein